MIRHIVILQLKKDGTDYDSLLRRTIPLVKEIPGVVSYDIFENQSQYVSEDCVSFGVEIHFKDQKALDVFMEHPLHYEANSIFEKHLADPPFMVLTHPI